MSLTRGNIRPVDIEINQVSYSDHYPVVVRLKVGRWFYTVIYFNIATEDTMKHGGYVHIQKIG